ncbi:MAG: ATPase domain-containing protein [Candidatus Parvarchaeum sp.]
MVDKVKSGINGFDAIVNGGFVKNSIVTIYGSPGAGKSIFCAEFLREGLKNNEKVFYISMEQDLDSFLEQCDSFGFHEFKDNLNSNFVFSRMSGHDFKNFLSIDLPKILETRKEKHARIVIDPLTPFLWEVKDPSLQRNILTDTFKMLREFGTTLITIERYGDINRMELSEDIAIPIYLSDMVIILSMIYNQNFYQKAISIVKMRFSSHSTGMHPFDIGNNGINIFQDQPVF